MNQGDVVFVKAIVLATRLDNNVAIELRDFKGRMFQLVVDASELEVPNEEEQKKFREP